MRINASQNETTFGMLWKADLNRNETTFRDIISIATG